MTEKELLELLIHERVNMLLVSLDKKQPVKTEDYHDRILKAEDIIEGLPNDDKEMVQNYMENLVERMAREEPYLYKQGFIDGIMVIKKFVNL